MLKPGWIDQAKDRIRQPPSGGCVLKPAGEKEACHDDGPAAFRRLCVETQNPTRRWLMAAAQPPSGGCVLKLHPSHRKGRAGPAAFRRLCVETIFLMNWSREVRPSRLQAAVC